MRDEKSQKCTNPWYKFIAILCISVLTLFAIFELGPKRKTNTVKKAISKNEKEPAWFGKVLIASSGNDLKNAVAVQFETSRNFIVVHPSTEEYAIYSNNPNSYSANKMGSLLKKNNVQAVITGTMNIDTYQMLNSLNIEIYTGVKGNVENAFNMYKNNKLVSSIAPNNTKKTKESLKDSKHLVF